MFAFIITFIIISFFFKTIGSLMYNLMNNNNGRRNNISGPFGQIIEEFLRNIHMSGQHKGQKQYFNNQQGSQQRSRSQSSSSNASNFISSKEAYDILGLKGSESEEEIKAAYRNLVKKFHPDAGGNDYFCRKLTEAKDFLLEK